MSVLYGIDGCRGGWLVARVVEGNEPGLRPEFFTRTNLQPIFAEADKKRAEGRAKRLAVLAGEGMKLSLEDICQQRILLGRHLAQVDDLIDAAACVLTVKRIGNRQHVCFPAAVCKDSRKLRMEIVS